MLPVPNRICQIYSVFSRKKSEFWSWTNNIICAWIHKWDHFVICYSLLNTPSAYLAEIICGTIDDYMRCLELQGKKWILKPFTHIIFQYLPRPKLFSLCFSQVLTTQPAPFSPHTSQRDHLHHPANHQLPLSHLTLRNDLLPISSRFLWLTFHSSISNEND